MRHAVIMAGGSGTRLWPLSRRKHPKQLLRIFEGQSLLRRSMERLLGLLEPRQIYVIASKNHLPMIAEELPELPAENLIGEPCPRDTANAVGLAAHLLALRDAEGTMAVFTADQIITPVESFQDTVRRGFEAAETFADALITFGIRPTEPHTGYGYIHRGDKLADNVYEVRQFKEKPDLETAKRYLQSGEYYWNSGMFVWRIPTVLGQLSRHQPELDEGLRQAAADFADPTRSEAVSECFSRQRKISVDYALLEKADRVAVVEMPCRWLDVGSWTSLAEIIMPDGGGNTLAAPNVQLLDAKNNILVSETDHLLAAIGVEDLIIVHSADATLICHRRDSQRIKEMVERVQKEN